MNDQQRQKAAARIEELTFGENLSFAASEAYKLLRTNILFALPDEQKCRIIGVTSSLSGEGKSTTALNLAYMLAEMGQRTLLIEADMRLPTITRRLGLNTAPGLSNLLAGLDSGKGVMQHSGIQERLHIIASGDPPPNPSELLGSEQMKAAISVLAEKVDFIVMDLPPVNEVADALVASRLTDGLVVVVRQDYASRRMVDEAMRQLQYVNAKILGFVMTCAGGQGKGSYKRYSRYGYGEETAKRSRKKTKSGKGTASGKKTDRQRSEDRRR